MAQVGCVTPPSYYMDQCWLIANEILWHSSVGNFTRMAQYTGYLSVFEYHISKITATSKCMATSKYLNRVDFSNLVRELIKPMNTCAIADCCLATEIANPLWYRSAENMDDADVPGCVVVATPDGATTRNSMLWVVVCSRISCQSMSIQSLYSGSQARRVVWLRYSIRRKHMEMLHWPPQDVVCGRNPV